MNIAAQLEKYLYRSPKIYPDSSIANRAALPLVYQSVLRNAHRGLALAKNALYSAPRFDKELKQLQQDGALVLPNFLSEEDFGHVQAVFGQMQSKFEVQNARAPLTKMLLVTKYGYPKIEILDSKAVGIFQKNPFFGEMVERVTGIKSKLPPLVYFMEQSFAQQDLGSPHSDFQDLLHYDVNFPSLKAILYLEDTDKTNGAFRLAFGSHKPSWKRLKGEYKFACDNTSPQRQPNARPSVSSELFDLSRLTSIEGKKNTLVLFDARCVHARGEFKSHKPRRTIFVDFRSTLSAANFLPKLCRPKIQGHDFGH